MNLRSLSIKSFLTCILVHRTLFAGANDTGTNHSVDLEQCRLHMTVDNYLNYLTPVDIFATNADTNIACIKARFSLAIKLEFVDTVVLEEDDDVSDVKYDKVVYKEDGTIASDEDRGVRTMYYMKPLGYLPMEKYIYVEKTCPEFIKPFQQRDPNKNETVSTTTPQPDSTPTTPKFMNETKPLSDTSPIETTTDANDVNIKDKDIDLYDSDDELEMIITFECGKMAFTFRRDENKTYLASIKGNVQFDAHQVSDFIFTKPILLTSTGSNYHFKYDDLIEIRSEIDEDNWFLTANLYLTEIETFRDTTNRDFIKPPDKESKPYLVEPDPFNLKDVVNKLRSKQQDL